RPRGPGSGSAPRADPGGRAAVQPVLRAGPGRTAGAAVRVPVGSRERRSQDVEDPGQRHRAPGRPGYQAQERQDPHHRPEEGPARRPGAARDLPGVPAPHAAVTGHPGPDDRGVPSGDAAVRAVQDQPGRSDGRALPAVPRAQGRAGGGPEGGSGDARTRPRDGPADRGRDHGRRPGGGGADVSAGAEFAVRLPVFTGPFRLLADLILDRSLDVCDVPVASVTEVFVRAGAEESSRWSLEDATWFLAICAVLLELKVGRLLPRHVDETEEDLLGGTSPDLIYARSLELQAFRRMAENLAARMAEASLLAPRSTGPPPEFAHLYPDVMEKVT